MIKFTTGKYKYQLTEPYYHRTQITGYEDGNLFLEINQHGVLLIQPGYAWDGASGPAIDTPNFMRGSLVHDALYQLIHIGALPAAYRKAADEELRRVVLEDGMSWLRAQWVYLAVRAFGGLYLRLKK